jgi:hypothetical protein
MLQLIRKILLYKILKKVRHINKINNNKMKKIRFFNNKIKAKIENNNNHKFSIVTE